MLIEFYYMEIELTTDTIYSKQQYKNIDEHS